MCSYSTRFLGIREPIVAHITCSIYAQSCGKGCTRSQPGSIRVHGEEQTEERWDLWETAKPLKSAISLVQDGLLVSLDRDSSTQRQDINHADLQDDQNIAEAFQPVEKGKGVPRKGLRELIFYQNSVTGYV